MWPSLLAAFSLGFIGSLHCVGMCGPLVMSLPLQGLPARQQALRIGLYHTGRILTYALGGLLFGWIGRGIYFAGWQQGLTIALGILILGWVVVKAIGGRKAMPGWAGPFYSALQGWMSRLWKSPSITKYFLIGVGNGLLPCGMVYFAIAGALTAGSVWQSAGFMIFFGLGTLPMLLGLQITGMMISLVYRQQIRRVFPYLTALMAILLILRGLNLGIPMISPVMAVKPGHAIECH